jgi:hypothetical protein
MSKATQSFIPFFASTAALVTHIYLSRPAHECGAVAILMVVCLGVGAVRTGP